MFESEAGGEKEAGLDLIIPHYGEKNNYIIRDIFFRKK